MKHLKLYEQFVSDVLDKDITRVDTILDKVKAKRVYMGDEIGVNSEKFNNIEDLIRSQEFLHKLDKKNLKKGNIEYTRECETFLEDNLDLKFFLIFDKDVPEISEPRYMVIQSKPSKYYKWNSIKMYELNKNIKNFYDMLTNKTIEIIDNGENYIYLTSNAGKDWTLQNIDSKTDIYKNILSDDEIKSIARTRKVKINEV